MTSWPANQLADRSGSIDIRSVALCVLSSCVTRRLDCSVCGGRGRRRRSLSPPASRPPVARICLSAPLPPAQTIVRSSRERLRSTCGRYLLIHPSDPLLRHACSLMPCHYAPPPVAPPLLHHSRRRRSVVSIIFQLVLSHIFAFASRRHGIRIHRLPNSPTN